jgi:hypothetical protein
VIFSHFSPPSVERQKINGLGLNNLRGKSSFTGSLNQLKMSVKRRKLMLRKFFLTSLTLLFIAVGAGAARADTVIFSNFGPGMSFNPNSGLVVSGSGDSSPQVVAQGFTSTGNFNFSSAQLAFRRSTGSGPIQILLETDAGGMPGTIIESLNLNMAASPFASVVTVNSMLQPLLQSGVNYWLVAYAPADTFAAWCDSVGDVSTADNFAINHIPSPTGPWISDLPGYIRSAFQINGEVASTPEPSALLLFGTSLTAAAAALRKRRRLRTKQRA